MPLNPDLAYTKTHDWTNDKGNNVAFSPERFDEQDDAVAAGINARLPVGMTSEPSTPVLGQEWHGAFGIRKWSTDGVSFFWIQI